MKILLYWSLILISINAKSQLLNNKHFINKDTSEKIFIDTPHSTFHDRVFKYLLFGLKEQMPNKADSNWKEGLNSNYLGDWITIEKFKGKYFAYHPSEPFYNAFFRISDTILITNDFNEGFVSYPIINKRKSKNGIYIELKGLNENHEFLYIKQKTKKIFVVKSSLFNSGKLYSGKIYLVKRKDYYDFPIIVNYCPNNRCAEFNFK